MQKLIIPGLAILISLISLCISLSYGSDVILVGDENLIRCKECATLGQQSTVYERGGTTTAMGWTPFYDNDGRRHSHDPNITFTHYECSKGHTWIDSTHTRCWCGED